MRGPPAPVRAAPRLAARVEEGPDLAGQPIERETPLDEGVGLQQAAMGSSRRPA
jgi:hypothetical protein